MPFLKWLEKNAAVIVRNHPEVKKHGLWIVTSTCSTSKCALNAWTSKSKEVAVGFSGTMSQMAGLEVNGSWYTSSDDGGWNYFEQKVFQLRTLIVGQASRCVHRRAPFSLQQKDCCCECDKFRKSSKGSSFHALTQPPFRRTFRGDSGEGIRLPIIHIDGVEPYEISCERWSVEEAGESEDDSW
jgi:hypothetical protein